MTQFKYFSYFLFCSVVLLAISCNNDPVKNSQPNGNGGLDPDIPMDNLTGLKYPGIPIYTADMGKYGFTEMNSEWSIRKSASVSISSKIVRTGSDAQLSISYDGFSTTNDFVVLDMSIFGKLTNPVAAPSEILTNTKGISFRAGSLDTPLELIVEAFNSSGVLIESKIFSIQIGALKEFSFVFNTQNLHRISLKIDGKSTKNLLLKKGTITIDDVYLANNDTKPFGPAKDDTAFLKWLKFSSLRYFLWQYRVVNGNQGTVLEHYGDDDKVSLSGIGYAYAAFILATQEGMISESTARQRIASILKWQQAQNWDNGSEGKFGFPLHYFSVNGKGKWANDASAISTIDWAICAAGIRVVRQKYIADPEIVSICNELLDRPQWQEVIANNPNNSYEFGRIIKGFKATTGAKNPGVYADAYSEETELTYLEALASGKVNSLDLSRIFREKKQGQFVSWFGCGFTYNWLQLWTGTQEPYKSTSVLAFQQDAIMSKYRFGIPIMGLTACSTVSGMDSSGFIKWDKYISNQGSGVTGAPFGEIIQISPAAYGAALALPFQKATAIAALREYVKLGFYHPLLGLPDAVRIKDLPAGLEKAIPNWDPFDINIGPTAMAIEQTQQNSIGKLYLKDVAVSTNLVKLKTSIKN
ncbi:hypothetical protein [Flavobacterium sp.]|uniref:hypothetical protein n=1 Tax=Flavobacterium sp. TaxID=239 RepID=UPI00286E1A7C|nr:hypothetical protein [Flavobacterium sp.]